MLLPAIPILQIGSDLRLLRVCSDLIREVSGASSELSVLKPGSRFDLTPYPVILVQLDDTLGDRLELIRRLRRDSPAARLLILTARPTVREAVEFMRMGGEEYLELPIESEAVKKALMAALESASGTSGVPANSSLSLAYVDEHTGLPNARHLSVVLDAEIEKIRATSCAEPASVGFAVLFIDIDHFKAVNDRHGHRTGNEALRAMGWFLRQQLREGDRLFRYAGDEFVALISRGDAVAASLVSDRLSAAVGAHEFEVPGEGGAILTLNLHVSIGIAICPDQASTREEILEMADRALYRVKRPVSAGLSVEVSGAAAAAHAMGLS